jgi:hypothetical protein
MDFRSTLETTAMLFAGCKRFYTEAFFRSQAEAIHFNGELMSGNATKPLHHHH